MADLAITVSNSVNTFGPWPDKWGLIQWGVDKWGEGTQDLPVEIEKFFDNSLVPDGLTLTFVKESAITIANSLAPDGLTNYFDSVKFYTNAVTPDGLTNYFNVEKFYSNTPTFDGLTNGFSVENLISDTLTPDGLAYSFDQTAARTIENTITTASDATEETLEDPAGYNYMFVKPTADADDRNTATFTAASDASTSWSSAAAGSVTWS